MKPIFWRVYQTLSILILAGVLVEFFFAGMGVFHAASFQIHRITGVGLWAGSLLLLLSAALLRTDKRTLWLSILLFMLMLIQPLLLQIHQPFIKALHPVNGLVITAVSAALVRFRGLNHGGQTRC